MSASILSSVLPNNLAHSGKVDAINDVAMKLEAAFLAEMLKSAGLGETSRSFGGGAGEEQYSSFLVRTQSEEIARAGGIGLAELIFAQLMEADRSDETQ